jgi:methylase of polypeptide subunit release factors
MLNGRDKVGSEVAAAVSQLAMAKHKRLQFPFGPALPDDSIRGTAHEHNIREIPLSGGALGCALWDGGAVLARWVYLNGAVFHGQRVLELGCGVGLAGILAAHWAQHVTLSDYVAQAVANAAYNASLNSHEAELEGEEDGAIVSGAPYSYEIADRVSAAVMDWDREMRLDTQPDGAEADAPCCSRAGNPAFHVQGWRHCRTCWTDPSSGCCTACAAACHVGHELGPEETSRFRCDCADGCVAQPRPHIEPVDVIIGSELTYNLLSCASLAHVVDKYLKPDGVFYEVLSNDRDGVAVFREEIEKRGFVTVRHDAPPHLVGNFGTRKWSKQDEETYSLYTWRRAGANRAGKPDMQ